MLWSRWEAIVSIITIGLNENDMPVQKYQIADTFLPWLV